MDLEGHQLALAALVTPGGQRGGGRRKSGGDGGVATAIGPLPHNGETQLQHGFVVPKEIARSCSGTTKPCSSWVSPYPNTRSLTHCVHPCV